VRDRFLEDGTLDAPEAKKMKRDDPNHMLFGEGGPSLEVQAIVHTAVDEAAREKFLSWLKNRLIPAFEKKYRRKKMVLILDNASYHHARGEDWVVPSKMKKVECGAFLRRVGVRSITVKESEKSEKLVTFPAAKFTADTWDGGPTVKQLQHVVSDYVKSHPAINTTLVEQLMAPMGHRLLYTPPYESWMQPIELVWARVKHQVALQSKVGRKWQETAEQTKTAMSELTAELCASLIKHTEKLMNEWLQSEEAGSLRKYESIEALGRISAAARALCTDLNLQGSLVTGDAHEDQENQ
jgi:transposase